MMALPTSPSAPASAGSTSASSAPLSTPLADTLARFCTLSGKPTASRSWLAAWRRKPWLRRLCSLISAASPDEPWMLCGGEWGSWLEGFPVRGTASPGSGASRPTSGTSGRTSGVWFATWERGDWSSRTSQGSLFQTGPAAPERPSSGYSETWPKRGGLRSGRLYRLEPWEPRTSASDFSSWPSIRCEDAESCGQHPVATDSLNATAAEWMTPSAVQKTYTRDGGDPAMERMALLGQAQEWQTPAVPNGGRMGARTEAGREGTERHIEHQAAEWSTPNVPERGPESRAAKAARGSGGTDLQTEAQEWPTPNAADHKTSADYPHKGGNLTLVGAASLFSPQVPPTGSGSLFSMSDPTSSPPSSAERTPTLIESVMLGVYQRGVSRRLNPNFVDWLMGWEPGWTDSERAATESSRSRQRLRSAIACFDFEEAAE